MSLPACWPSCGPKHHAMHCVRYQHRLPLRLVLLVGQRVLNRATKESQ